LDADEDITSVGRRQRIERRSALSLKFLKEVKDVKVKLHNAAICYSTHFLLLFSFSCFFSSLNRSQAIMAEKSDAIVPHTTHV
jgi:hypothetical protein